MRLLITILLTLSLLTYVSTAYTVQAENLNCWRTYASIGNSDPFAISEVKIPNYVENIAISVGKRYGERNQYELRSCPWPVNCAAGVTGVGRIVDFQINCNLIAILPFGTSIKISTSLPFLCSPLA